MAPGLMHIMVTLRYHVKIEKSLDEKYLDARNEIVCFLIY